MQIRTRRELDCEMTKLWTGNYDKFTSIKEDIMNRVFPESERLQLLRAARKHVSVGGPYAMTAGKLVNEILDKEIDFEVRRSEFK